MNFWNGFSQGLILNGVVFWGFVTGMGFLQSPNFNVLAIILCSYELLTTVVGVGVYTYTRWKR